MSESQQNEFTRSLSKDSTQSLSRENDLNGLSKNDEHDDPISVLKQTEIRRDSSSSNDSSGKKQASLNEIKDLYSALQDLVKTNVTPIPIASRNQNILTSSPDESKVSPRGSPRVEKLRVGQPATLRLNDPATILIDSRERKISSKASKSASDVTDYSKKNKKHKRGSSTGNLETIVQKLKRSPKTNRKLSHDTHSTNSDKENNIKAIRKNERSSSAVSDKIKKDIKILRRGSNASDTKSKKNWKPKLFSRLRSKSSHGMLDDDDNEKCTSEGDGGATPPLASIQRSRRSSEADANRVEISNKPRNSSNKQLSCPPVRKQRNSETTNSVSSMCSANVKDIDQLVAALNLEYSDGNTTTENSSRASTLSTTSYKSTESELSKLESWFEKAAAEAVLHQSKCDDDTCDSEEIKKTKHDNESKDAKTGGKRTAAVRRGHSQSRVREERRYMRKSAPKNMNADSDRLRVYSLGQLHARSTPNLRDNDSSDLSDGNTSCEKYVLKNRSPGETRRMISLDEPACRLPKTPLFYVPDQKQSNKNGLRIMKQNSFMESDVFYTEQEVDDNSSRLTKANKEFDSFTQTNQEEVFPKSSTPNTLFATGRYIDLSVNTKQLKTDDNANFCDTNIADEKSIWGRFYADETKQKAIMT